MRVLFTIFFVTLAGTAEARWYPCPLIRWYVKNHSRAEVDAMAEKYKITAKEKRAALACLKEKE